MTRPIRVLCVDDNKLLAEALQRRLEFEPGLEWSGWVGDSHDAADAVARRTPDVVMLDIDMPGRDCFELVAELASRHPETRVVLFSGHVRAEYLDRAVDAGAWGYISKNEGIDDVIELIRRVVAGEFAVSSEVSQESARRESARPAEAPERPLAERTE